MPTYFGPVAPYCPVSRDQPVGPSQAPRIRTTIPHVHDLPSALAAANIARSIITQIVTDRVINNFHYPPVVLPKTIDKRRHSNWHENKAARVKRKYKYYGVDEDGKQDLDTWIITERIEKMVWVDSGWKTSLTWSYGDKGEGEPVSNVVAVGGQSKPVELDEPPVPPPSG